MEIESGEKLMVMPTDFFFFFVIDSVPGTDPYMVWRTFLFESTSKLPYVSWFQ